MLSILQRQAKHLEKELNDTRQNLLERSRELDGEKSRVTERDERIETLEIEIDALRNRPRASPKKRAASEPDGAPADADADDAPLSDEELEQLRALVKQLNASLEKKGRKLTHAELRANTYEIQMLAQKSAHMQQVDHLRERLRALERELQRLRDAAREQAGADGADAELARLRLALREERAAGARRDEQIAFLTHVHDASQKYDWETAGARDATIPDGALEWARGAAASPRARAAGADEDHALALQMQREEERTLRSASAGALLAAERAHGGGAASATGGRAAAVS